MDKRIRQIDANDKKADNKIKDRGDLKKVNDKIIKKNDVNTQVNKKIAYPERGDSERKTSTNQKPEKIRLNIVVRKQTIDESKPKYVTDCIAEKEFSNKRNIEKDGQEKTPNDLELRKRIRDKYTKKLKSPVNKSEYSDEILNKKDSRAVTIKSEGNKPVDRPKKQLAEETTQTKEGLNKSPTSSAKTDVDKKLEKNSPKPEKVVVKQDKNSVRRKPMIKTITSRSGPVRIYKAVTFVDQKRTPTPLEINIPSDTIRKQKVSRYTDTSSLKFKTKPTVSRSSIKEKPAVIRNKPERRREKRIKHVPSRDNSLKEVMSPPTEVARWAPASIDQQTKPYYEAWVNTTLAAISKGSKKDKHFYEKQREMLKSIQKALEERPNTPELFYENFASEKYTGRIKITQRC